MNKALKEKIETIIKDAIEGQMDWESYYEGAYQEPTDEILALITAHDERLVERIDKLPVILVDVKFSSDDKPKLEQAILLSDAIQLIREEEA